MFISATLVGAWLSMLALTPTVAHADIAQDAMVMQSESQSSVVVHSTNTAGSGTAEVHITSVVNGEIVLDIHETSRDGTPISISETVTTQDGSASAQVSIDATRGVSAVEHTAATTEKEREDTKGPKAEPHAPHASTHTTEVISSNEVITTNQADDVQVIAEHRSFLNTFFATFATTLRHVVSLFT